MSAAAVVPITLVNAASAPVAATISPSPVSSTSSSVTEDSVAATTSILTIAAPTELANDGVGGGDRRHANPPICRFFLRGICRFGAMCRFSHDLSAGEVISLSEGDLAPAAADKIPPKASTSSAYVNWANAAPFVPGCRRLLRHSDCDDDDDESMITTPIYAAVEVPATSNKSWAEVVGADAQRVSVQVQMAEPGSMNTPCPYESPCPYEQFCPYAVHLELCKMCDQYCLHPNDAEQRRKHNQECLRQHEQAMELSFAIARSKDKTCGICFDTIMEKSGREKRFGILPNCSHIFCLECIRKWRQAKQFEHKIIRSCPECRVASDFVCPSAFWVETKEEKDKLLNDYRSALGVKDCKYFQKGDGKCPFGNKCFYKHALPNGDLVDVGCPKKARRIRSGNADVMDLLDIYLWEFIEQRDYRWLELLSNESDDSDDADWALD